MSNSFGFYRMLNHKRMYQNVLNMIPNDKEMNVLEYGIGYGIWAYALRMWSREYIRITGVDIYDLYVNKQKDFGLYDEVICGNAINMDFVDNSFDLVIAMELIEHMSKEDGLLLLKKMEKYSSGMVILTTPLGYYDIKNPADGSKYMRHKSGWIEEDFLKLGYEVKIVNKSGLRRKSVIMFDNLRRFMFRIRDRSKGIIAYKYVG